MVIGVQRFREHFREFQDAFVVIGGVACDEWFNSLGLRFRGTRDVDIVLIVEALSRAFVARFWEFVEAGGYEIRERSPGKRIYYRFAKPKKADFPFMMEFFGRQPHGIQLAAGQHVVPIRDEEATASLSAILMDDSYYDVVKTHRMIVDDLPTIPPVALIPLKARAWLELTQRRKKGEKVDEADIKKHRNDVFRLAATLPGVGDTLLADSIREDLRAFIGSFQPDCPEWPAIRASLKESLGAAVPEATALLEALTAFFHLREAP